MTYILPSTTARLVATILVGLSRYAKLSHDIYSMGVNLVVPGSAGRDYYIWAASLNTKFVFFQEVPEQPTTAANLEVTEDGSIEINPEAPKLTTNASLEVTEDGIIEINPESQEVSNYIDDDNS